MSNRDPYSDFQLSAVQISNVSRVSMLGCEGRLVFKGNPTPSPRHLVRRTKENW